MEFSFQVLSWNKLCEGACAAQRPDKSFLVLCSVAGHRIVLVVMVSLGNFWYFFSPWGLGMQN